MEIITERVLKDKINLYDITNKYLVVCIYNGNPTILTKGYDERGCRYGFFILNSEFITGNRYTGDNQHNSRNEKIKEAIKMKYPIQAFHESDWKEALQWLIDNG